MEKSTGKHVLYDLIYQKPQARQNETLYCLWIPKDEANDKEKQGEENSTARLTVSEKVAGDRMAVEGLCRALQKSRPHVSLLELAGEYTKVHGVRIFSSRPVFH